MNKLLYVAVLCLIASSSHSQASSLGSNCVSCLGSDYGLNDVFIGNPSIFDVAVKGSGSGAKALETGYSDLYDIPWQVALTTPADPLTGVDDVSVKARYLNSSGQNDSITSPRLTLGRKIPAVPEPASFVFLGTGLFAAAIALRWKLTV
ncbi:MAG: PEP-CTERM sorting domain-containing protein [Edaphobacter sp.]